MRNYIDDISKIRSILEEFSTKEKTRAFELEKSISIIMCLLDKAENTITGRQPKSRWAWVDEGYTSPEKIIDQAMKILCQIQDGTNPFEGKFAEPGGTVIDHALVKKDELYHLIYIRGKACTSWPEFPMSNFGHSVSSDLQNWNVKEPVLQASPGTWEEYQVWAPHIIMHNDEYWMFYTGVNYHVAQAIGLAKSTDLMNWERYGDKPLIKPGNWGFWDDECWSDCRDPMVLQDGDSFFIYYTASLKERQDEKITYCIGIASSKDLINWRDEGYTLLKGSMDTPPESPFVVKKDGRYYLFYTDYKAGTVFAVSEHPAKGWEDAMEDKRVVVPGVSASEIFEDNGKWYITFISHFENQLHFFEIRELIWNADDSFSVSN